MTIFLLPSFFATYTRIRRPELSSGGDFIRKSIYNKGSWKSFLQSQGLARHFCWREARRRDLGYSGNAPAPKQSVHTYSIHDEIKYSQTTASILFPKPTKERNNDEPRLVDFGVTKVRLLNRGFALQTTTSNYQIQLTALFHLHEQKPRCLDWGWVEMHVPVPSTLNPQPST